MGTACVRKHKHVQFSEDVSVHNIPPRTMERDPRFYWPEPYFDPDLEEDDWDNFEPYASDPAYIGGTDALGKKPMEVKAQKRVPSKSIKPPHMPHRMEGTASKSQAAGSSVSSFSPPSSPATAPSPLPMPAPAPPPPDMPRGRSNRRFRVSGGRTSEDEGDKTSISPKATENTGVTDPAAAGERLENGQQTADFKPEGNQEIDTPKINQPEKSGSKFTPNTETTGDGQSKDEKSIDRNNMQHSTSPYHASCVSSPPADRKEPETIPNVGPKQSGEDITSVRTPEKSSRTSPYHAACASSLPTAIKEPERKTNLETPTQSSSPYSKQVVTDSKNTTDSTISRDNKQSGDTKIPVRTVPSTPEKSSRTSPYHAACESSLHTDIKEQERKTNVDYTMQSTAHSKQVTADSSRTTGKPMGNDKTSPVLTGPSTPEKFSRTSPYHVACTSSLSTDIIKSERKANVEPTIQSSTTYSKPIAADSSKTTANVTSRDKQTVDDKKLTVRLVPSSPEKSYRTSPFHTSCVPPPISHYKASDNSASLLAPKDQSSSARRYQKSVSHLKNKDTSVDSKQNTKDSSKTPSNVKATEKKTATKESQPTSSKVTTAPHTPTEISKFHVACVPIQPDSNFHATPLDITPSQRSDTKPQDIHPQPTSESSHKKRHLRSKPSSGLKEEKYTIKPSRFVAVHTRTGISIQRVSNNFKHSVESGSRDYESFRKVSKTSHHSPKPGRRRKHRTHSGRKSRSGSCSKKGNKTCDVSSDEEMFYPPSAYHEVCIDRPKLPSSHSLLSQSCGSTKRSRGGSNTSLLHLAPPHSLDHKAARTVGSELSIHSVRSSCPSTVQSRTGSRTNVHHSISRHAGRSHIDSRDADGANFHYSSSNSSFYKRDKSVPSKIVTSNDQTNSASSRRGSQDKVSAKRVGRSSHKREKRRIGSSESASVQVQSSSSSLRTATPHSMRTDKRRDDNRTSTSRSIKGSSHKTHRIKARK